MSGPKITLRPRKRRSLPPGLGAGAGALRRRRRRPATLLPELSVYLAPEEPVPGPPRLSSVLEGESTSLQGSLAGEPHSLYLVGESTSLRLVGDPPPLHLVGELTSLAVDEEPSQGMVPQPVVAEPTRRPGQSPEPTVDEETELVARGDVFPSVLRLGDLRLPDPSPLALPTCVLPGDWALESVDSTPSQGVSLAVADDVEARPVAEELELLSEDASVSDDDDLGDLLSPVPPEGPDIDDLADLLEAADQEEEAQRSMEGPGPVRRMRGEPLPHVDSVDEELPIDLDAGGPIDGPEAWGAAEAPTRVDRVDQLDEALRLLHAVEAAPLSLGIVDGVAPPSPEDLRADGLSLDLDTESVELLSLDLLLDAPSDPSANPDVVRDLESGRDEPLLPEDDLTGPTPTAAWIELAAAPSGRPRRRAPIYLELVDPGLATLEESAAPEEAAAEIRAEPPQTALAMLPEELELVEDELPPLDDRPPEESGGADSVDELLILDDEDTGPASLTLEMEKEEVADLLAEGGAIRVELKLGEKAASTPEEARKGVAVQPARPLRRWDGKSGETGERTTDLVALARLQHKSGAAARAPEALSEEEDDVELDLLVEFGDDWLAELPKAAPATAEGVAEPTPHEEGKKADKMSPYYEDTMPGWLPGDEEGSTRGAPRPSDITSAGKSKTAKTKSKRSKTKKPR